MRRISPINLTNVVSEEDRENEEEVQENEIANDYIIEPNAEELIASLIPTVLSQKIFTAAVDSNASEHAARTLAMQVATDNANELIQDLTKQYNKSRQQAITNELLDIVGGFHEVINHLSFVLKQKKEAKKNSRLTFFSLLSSFTSLKGRNSLRSNSLPFFDAPLQGLA